jgi:hypothetical protein
VGQKLPQSDRPLGGAELRRARCVEPLQNLRALQLVDDLCGRLVELKLAPLDHLHRRRGRDGLGHGRDPEDRVEGHVLGLRKVARSERARIGRAGGVSGQRNDPRYPLGFDRAAERLVD